MAGEKVTGQQASWNLEKQLRQLTITVKSEAKGIADAGGKLVLLDFIVGFLLIFRSISVFSQSFVALVLLLFVLFRATNRAKYSMRQANLVAALFFVAFCYLGVVSVMNGESTNLQIAQRLMRMGAVVGLALFIADGRINFRSILMGLGAGLLFNAAGFYAGIAPADYGSYLTGWLQDKNVSGLYLAMIPLLMVVIFTKPWQRTMIVLIALPLLWETGSRTSIGGFILGVLWLFFAGRLNLVFKVILGGIVMWLFEWAQNTFADSEIFGDRTGTDWFRGQIDAASWEKVQDTPWYGQGFGQAFATLENGDNEFFHNSFWTLFVEGGWFWLILVLCVTFFTVFVLKQRQEPEEPRKTGLEAAMVVLLICSWRLGEVMVTMPWGLTLGLALSYLPRTSIATPLDSAYYIKNPDRFEERKSSHR